MSASPFIHRYTQQSEVKFDFDRFISIDLSGPTRKHLVRVYTIITQCVLIATLSGAFALYAGISSFIFALVNLAAVVWFAFSTPSSTIKGFRLQPLLLWTIASTAGLMLEPVCKLALEVDPTLPLSALLLSTVIFASFTFFALKVDSMTMLSMYAPFSALISGFSLLMLVGYLFGISLLPYSFMLGISSLILCGHIIFDTALIIQRIQQGNVNHYEHALVLFLDFVQIFVRVLRLLMESKMKDNRKKRSSSSSS